ncbi:MAG: transporter, permease component [Herbinix sp.]|jgi:ABC-type sugar transport system permease subunit|nr:transporter, permease component [Herbinix sp.]
MKTKKMMTFRQRQNRQGYKFMMPWIIGFLLFTAFPFLATVYLSFTSVKQNVAGFNIKFIGLDNYIMAFFENTEYVPALIGFVTQIIPYAFVIVIISFILAYMLNHIKFMRGMLRTIYFLPVIIMSGPVMQQMIDAGVNQSRIENVGIEGSTNLFILQMVYNYSPDLARIIFQVLTQLSTILWFTGIPIILFINGLQKINPSLLEAAKIDSANSWQILWKIIIPIIKPIALVVVVFTLAQLGTYKSTNPMYELITGAIENTAGGLGIAATYAWVYTLLVLLIIGIAFLLFKDRVKGRRR